MKVISLVNQKGGIGKTTTAQALIEGLRAKGYKVLGIDMDTQANLTRAFGKRDAKHTISELWAGHELVELIEDDFIASSGETVLVNPKSKNTIEDSLKTISKKYDFCIIDCPPKIDKLVVSVLMASNVAIIPSTADGFSIDGIEISVLACQTFKVKSIGILFVKFNPRATLNKDLYDSAKAFASKKHVKLYETTIRESIAIREAQALNAPLLTYNKRANAIKDYQGFIDELLQQIKK